MPSQRYIITRTPVIENGNTAEFMQRKMVEEIDELLAEVTAQPIDIPKLLAELHDVNQTVYGYLQSWIRESGTAPELVHKYTESIALTGNMMHWSKIRNRAAERGWTVIHE